MSRLVEIREKLEYVESQRQALMDLLWGSKKEEREPKFLTHTVADILSSSRECYDYCAKDILEIKIITSTTNQKLIERFRAGNVKSYFPFYKKELTNPKNPFYKLSIIEPLLNAYILNIADNIEANNMIPNTLFKYGDIIKLKDLVNEKKHDRLIAVESNSEQEILIENINFKMIVPIKSQLGWNRFQVAADSDISRVAEFRLEHIDEEVAKFCMFASKSTSLILEDIYAKFF